MKKVAFMFPGQGSQKVGMGQDLFEASEEVRNLYAIANNVLDVDIQDIMFEGPTETLTETENAQPALVLSSIAAYTLLTKADVKPQVTVGHSLGEYSALVAAQALTIEEALPLVATRGRLMEEAFPKGQGTMAAVLGLQADEIRQVIKEVAEDEVVDIANLNCPGQVVISGSQAGIEQASALLKEAGARRVLPLNVSGPFHSRLMQTASKQFAQALETVSLHDAVIPVYANVTASAVQNKAEINPLLVQQLYSPVRFEESIRNIIDDGIDAIVEVGNGNVLCGLVKKIDRKTKTFSVQDTASLEKFLEWYREEA